MTTPRQIKNVVNAALKTPWAIESRKLEQIAAVLELRANGERLTPEEVRRRIGADDSIEIDLDGDDDDQQAELYQVLGGVAVIPLQGVMAPKMNLFMRISGGTSTDLFRAAVRQATADPAVKAILLVIDSPGGSVYGTEEAAQAVREARDKKPTIAVGTNLMASAAYYVGSAAGEVVASPSAELGSIGVYSLHTEFSKADAAAGVKRTIVKAGRYKADANDTEPLTTQARETLQEEVDSYYELMVGSIATNRRTDRATVEERFGQGKLLIASKAVAAGLADRVGTLDAELAALRATINADADPYKSPFPPQGAHAMDPTIRQALIDRGLLNAAASHDVAEAVLAAYFKTSGQTQPTETEALLAALEAKAPAAPPVPPLSPAVATFQTGLGILAPTVQHTDPSIAAASAAAERGRILDIQARAELLGIDAEVVEQAITAGTSVGDFLTKATETIPKNQGAIAPVPGKAQADKFNEAAVGALAFHCGIETDAAKLSAGSREIRHCSALELAKESLRQSIGRAPIGDPDDIARAALGDPDAMRILGADFPAQTPGDFPNILSNLANKALESAPEFVGTTYQTWAHRMAPLPDFKPATLVRYGEFGEMPLHVDGDNFEQSEILEDYSWIAVDSYGDEFGLTPRMIVDDNLGALTDAMADKKAAHGQTLNRLCVNILTGNPACVDGFALFNLANHGNDIAAGAAPTTVQLAAMRLLLRRQTGLGGRPLAQTINLLLIPEDIETVTQQLLLATLNITPIIAITTEPFRGRVQFEVEPMLAANSATIYYGFANPARARSIVYAHQRGFESMKTRNYYNPQNNCRFWQFEGRFAAAINNYRGVVRNNGA